MTPSGDQRSGDGDGSAGGRGPTDPLGQLLRSAGAVAGLAGLAGCNALGGTDSGPDSGDRAADTPADANASSSPPTTGPTAQPTAAGGEPGTATATPAPTATPCPDADPVEADISSVETEIADVQSQIDERNREITRLLGLRGQLPDGWDDATLAAARATAESIRASVVVLQFEFGGGTGWFIDESHVITNAHVASPPSEATVFTLDGRELSATVVGRVENWRPDVAVLETDGTGDPLPLGSSEDLDPRTPVVQVGHPFGAGYWVTSLGRYLWRKEAFGQGSDYDTLYTSVVGRQGVSGSPLVNLDGEVVGLTWGAVDRDGTRQAGQAPDPASPRVVDYPIAPNAWGQHVPIETVVDRYKRWTA